MKQKQRRGRAGAAAVSLFASLATLIVAGCGSKMYDGGPAAQAAAKPAPPPAGAPPEAQQAAAQAAAQTQYMNQQYTEMGRAQDEARAKAGK